jgi:predicted ATPase/class 3 adenylate cyclase
LLSVGAVGVGMADLLTGTLTFLFSDLESSTRLWEDHAEAMKEALAGHDRILRDAVAAHGGYVVKGTGDGLHAVFETAHAAAVAAVGAQRSLAEQRWGATGPLRVRMGLHTGEAEARAGDYYGPVLNRAARLTAAAHGGQILVTQATEAVVRDRLGGDILLVDLGEHRLRDLSRPEHVFQVQAAGLTKDFPPLRSLDAFPGNLPLQVSSFIGRGREVARVTNALDEARVVTLTGVGGVGKTRLALQVAAEVLPRFREGAWLCEFAAIRDPAGVVGALAAVFGVTARAGQSLEESLVEFLRTKQLLLVVDNCEHLVEAVADVLEVLERSCAGLVVLATSREGLALEGEQVVPVPSLPGPPVDADLAAVGRADAVQLFVERARGVDPEFVLTVENAAAVAQVCRRLDGVPLAIELAAARVTAMNAAELARGLDRRFEVLAGGRRRAVQRHQTLRAAIDWSYELLTEAERRLLARLAVFAGGGTHDAAEVVCAGAPIEARRMFDLLTSLVARSLVVADRDRPETRYRLLETIREYGEERLAQHDETEGLRARHADYYADFASLVSEEILGPHQIEAGRRLLAEQDNLLTAMNYAIDTDNAELALRLLRNTPAPLAQVGYEVRLPVDPILKLTGASEHPLYAYALAVASIAAAQRGDLESAETLCGHAFAAAQRLGDPDHEVAMFVCVTRTALAFSIGAVHDAATHTERAAEIARSVGRLPYVASGLNGAAVLYAMADDADAAVPLATEGLALARRLGIPSLIAMGLSALAGALADQDTQRAQALLRESVRLRAGLDYENWGELTQAVLISARLGDWPQTLELASRSIRHLHWIGAGPLLGTMFNVVSRALTPANMKAAAVLQGAARHHFTAAAPALDRSASAPSSTVPASRSSDAASFVAELRRESTRLLRDNLGDQRLRALRAEGEAMTTDEAVAHALDAITHAQQAARQ